MIRRFEFLAVLAEGDRVKAANNLPRVAFLGIGLMGYPMALRLLRAGYAVIAWNRTFAKAARLAPHGAQVSETLADAVRDADVIITMLEAGPVVASVLETAAESVRKDALVIDMSSTSPAEARACAAMVNVHGAQFLDAPVSGGVVGAEAGTLAIMAGGAAEDFYRAKALLEIFGHPTLVGSTGAGQLTKLCNQLIVGGTLTIVAEALLLARAGGADPAAVRQALRGGFAESRILEVHGQRMLDRNFTPGGQVKSQSKDMENILAAATGAGLDLPATSVVANLYRGLLQTQPHADHSAVLIALEKLNPAYQMDPGHMDAPCAPRAENR